MKKNVFFAMLILSVTTSLMACGNNTGESVIEETETPIVEEAVSEPKPEPGEIESEEKEPEVEEESEDVEKDAEEKEPEKDYSWVDTYIDYLNHLDYEAGYDRSALIYVNDDFIPEIIFLAHSDEYFADYSYYMGLTVNDDEIETLELSGNNELSYIPRDNKLLNQLYEMHAGTGTDDVYSVVENKWNSVFKGEYDGSSALDPDAEPNSADIIYYVGKEVSEEEYNSQLNLAFDKGKAEIVDFKYSIDELKEVLNQLRTEADDELPED